MKRLFPCLHPRNGHTLGACESFLLLILLAANCLAEGAFGVWKAEGEVALDRIGGGGRTTTSSTIVPRRQARRFRGRGCSGIQSSRRGDSRTVEILRRPRSRERTRLVRRLAAQPERLVLEITEQQPGGRRVERRLVLEKQSGAKTSQRK